MISTAEIRARAQALGFDAVGFARAALGPETGVRLRDFLDGGHHGEMAWLEARSDQRADPRKLWPEVRSVIALGMSYAPEGDALATLGQGGRGNISVYARNRDYHDVIKGRLKHLAQFIVARAEAGAEVKVFVDTAPVMEKPLAQSAGIGWQGKHTNLVSRAHGSWLFLGEVFTTLELPPDPPHADRCGSCTRCMAACPTAAIPAPYRLEATRCISYLTIEHAGPRGPIWRRRLFRLCRGWMMRGSARSSRALPSSGSAATVSCGTSPLPSATVLIRPCCRSCSVYAATPIRCLPRPPAGPCNGSPH
jgi:epoxyqueuosine reductase